MPKPKTLPVDALAPLFQLDRAVSLSLQEQIRRTFISAIGSGVLPASAKLPSSRKLAEALHVSRNTTMIAYQTLIAEGHLVSMERSGVFVPEAHLDLAELPTQIVDLATVESPSVMGQRLVAPPLRPRSTIIAPPDWQTYRYPFLEGRYDQSLFPTTEWREASRMALAVTEVEAWSADPGEGDDDLLIEEIRTKLLPRRGIEARRNEVLITSGEQQALHLATRLLVTEGARAGIEEPGLPETRALLKGRNAELVYLPVDDDGLVVHDLLANCDVITVSPSRQRPTAVTLPLERRKALLELAETHDFLIIEDDFECEMNYLDSPIPSLRSLDGGNRVVYIASLSKVLAPGIGLGVLVGPPELISAARRLRSITTGRPSPNNQRAAAHFLALGHYDAMLRRLKNVFEERLIALRDALNHYRPLSIAISPVRGGTTYWVSGEPSLETEKLFRAAQARGVLIEPVDRYFAASPAPPNTFRLGVTSLPTSRIREGIAQLSRAMQELADSNGRRSVSRTEPAASAVSGQQITEALSGATLFYRTVYGETSTIILHPDGRMTGQSGEAGEDRDTGRWWVDGDMWFRQWKEWAYGEAVGYRVALVEDQIWWLDAKGNKVDAALFVEPN
ncbi:MAG: PLP-dependent aminotransferase family protein [Pseudomonadota bacterium]